VDERAAQGLRFGPAADDYQRGRPDWPPAAVEHAARALGLAADATVVDLGAGTGKLTRLLAERFVRVVAVEPLAAMRQHLADHLPQVEIHDGVAEQLPLADGFAQAVFVAEAFHWFDGPAALAEIARVLAPDGGVVLLWNIPAGGWDPPLPEQVRTLWREALSRGGEPGGPRLERGEWRAAFVDSPFAALQHEKIPHELVRDREGLIANAMSVSSIAGLPADERDALRTALRVALPAAQFRQPLLTRLYWARRSGGRWCDHCGRDAGEGGHDPCRGARALEPPRYCPHCRRRMKVQVLPNGWRAACVVHGHFHA
jgi:SAM-dependent methyltransferase